VSSRAGQGCRRAGGVCRQGLVGVASLRVECRLDGVECRLDGVECPFRSLYGHSCVPNGRPGRTGTKRLTYRAATGHRSACREHLGRNPSAHHAQQSLVRRLPPFPRVAHDACALALHRGWGLTESFDELGCFGLIEHGAVEVPTSFVLVSTTLMDVGYGVAETGHPTPQAGYAGAGRAPKRIKRNTLEPGRHHDSQAHGQRRHRGGGPRCRG